MQGFNRVKVKLHSQKFSPEELQALPATLGLPRILNVY